MNENKSIYMSSIKVINKSWLLKYKQDYHRENEDKTVISAPLNLILTPGQI